MHRREVSNIYKTTNYDEFIIDPESCDDARVISLMYLVNVKDKILPLVIVKKVDKKLKIISESDSFLAAKRLRLPVYYYEAYSMAKYSKSRFDLSYDDMQAILIYCLDRVKL